MHLLEKEEAEEKEVAKKSVSLLLLETACMLQVLLCEKLNVKNERSLLQLRDNVVYWKTNRKIKNDLQCN